MHIHTVLILTVTSSCWRFLANGFYVEESLYQRPSDVVTSSTTMSDTEQPQSFPKYCINFFKTFLLQLADALNRIEDKIIEYRVQDPSPDNVSLVTESHHAHSSALTYDNTTVETSSTIANNITVMPNRSVGGTTISISTNLTVKDLVFDDEADMSEMPISTGTFSDISMDSKSHVGNLHGITESRAYEEPSLIASKHPYVDGQLDVSDINLYTTRQAYATTSVSHDSIDSERNVYDDVVHIDSTVRPNVPDVETNAPQSSESPSHVHLKASNVSQLDMVISTENNDKQDDESTVPVSIADSSDCSSTPSGHYNHAASHNLITHPSNWSHATVDSAYHTGEDPSQSTIAATEVSVSDCVPINYHTSMHNPRSDLATVSNEVTFDRGEDQQLHPSPLIQHTKTTSSLSYSLSHNQHEYSHMSEPYHQTGTKTARQNVSTDDVPLASESSRTGLTSVHEAAVHPRDDQHSTIKAEIPYSVVASVLLVNHTHHGDDSIVQNQISTAVSLITLSTYMQTQVPIVNEQQLSSGYVHSSSKTDPSEHTYIGYEDASAAFVFIRNHTDYKNNTNTFSDNPDTIQIGSDITTSSRTISTASAEQLKDADQTKDTEATVYEKTYIQESSQYSENTTGLATLNDIKSTNHNEANRSTNEVIQTTSDCMSSAASSYSDVHDRRDTSTTHHATLTSPTHAHLNSSDIGPGNRTSTENVSIYPIGLMASTHETHISPIPVHHVAGIATTDISQSSRHYSSSVNQPNSPITPINPQADGNLTDNIIMIAEKSGQLFLDFENTCDQKIHLTTDKSERANTVITSNISNDIVETDLTTSDNVEKLTNISSTNERTKLRMNTMKLTSSKTTTHSSESDEDSNEKLTAS